MSVVAGALLLGALFLYILSERNMTKVRQLTREVDANLARTEANIAVWCAITGTPDPRRKAAA